MNISEFLFILLSMFCDVKPYGRHSINIEFYAIYILGGESTILHSNYGTTILYLALDVDCGKCYMRELLAFEYAVAVGQLVHLPKPCALTFLLKSMPR